MLVLFGANSAWASYTLNLAAVPQYCQYAANYCGSASAQMIMNGYPDAAACQLIDQPTIYSWIETNQTEVAPFKAPGMVRDAIHHFNAPPGSATFVARAYSTAPEAMYKILVWMRRTNYPAAAIINGNHWVVITGFVTDVDPESAPVDASGNHILNLEWIDYHDPLPFCG